MKKGIIPVAIVALIAVLGVFAVRRINNTLTCDNSTINERSTKTQLELFNQGVNYALKGQKREFLVLHLWQSEKAKQCYTLALQNYNEALRLEPAHISSLSNRANTFMRLGEYDKAIDDFLKILELNPDNQHARNGLARAYEESGDRETAVLKYEEAITFMENSDYWQQLHPTTIEAYRARLVYLRGQVKVDE